MQEAMVQDFLPSASEIKSGIETVDSVAQKIKQNKGASKCKREECCLQKPCATL